MVERLDFGKTKEIFELPNLVEIQTNSYKEFLQLNVPKTKRENKGLQAVFNYIFPVESVDEKFKLEFVNYILGRPKYSKEEAREKDVSYATPLKCKMRLRYEKEVKEQDVYFGEIPLMTEHGNFIINGDDRVVVNQLHRSPGVSFGETKQTKGRSLFSARIIPYRGSWIEFEFDKSNNLNVFIDRRRKFVFATFLRALGYPTNKDILEAICGIEKVNIKRKNQWNKYEGRVSAEDVKNSKEDKVILPAFSRITKKIVNDKLSSYKGKVNLIKNNFIEVINSLSKDSAKSEEEALLAIYRKLRPGDPPTIESARSLLNRMFFDSRRYDMSNIGWFIINRKFGTNFSHQQRELDKKVIVETIKYLLNLKKGEGEVDDIDHLGNRRVRTVGELLSNQIQIGLARVARIARERMNIYDTETMMPHNIINTKLVSSAIRDFFTRGRLSQFMDQTNPLAETTHKRRLSALGPGGLSRERAGFEVRDVHQSHYGRICPIETPEGPNIGLITSITTFAKINSLGFLKSPYRKVKDGKVLNKIEYLTADVEDKMVIAPANAKLDSKGKFIDKQVRCRYKQDVITVPPEKIDYIDVSPRQIVSIDAGLIPFLEHDDSNRALMGANMQRQAVPLLFTEPPLVGTGLENKVARDTGALVIAKNSGKVNSLETNKIKVGEKEYRLKKFQRSNANTSINQRPLVSVGDKVNKGDILADGPATKEGEISLGRNILVAFMSWHGHNFEDAILVNSRLVEEDIYTSVHIEEFEIESRDTRLGAEEITQDIPNVGEEALRNLDEEGIVRMGAEVKSGDILVGKVTPKVETELTPEEKLLRAIFGEKAGDIRDASLTVPSGVEGVVISTKVFSRKEVKSTRVQKSKERKKIKEINQEYDEKIKEVMKGKFERVAKIILGHELNSDLLDMDTGEVVMPKGKKITKTDIKILKKCDLDGIQLIDEKTEDNLDKVLRLFNDQLEELTYEQERQIDKIKTGDELPPGVIKKVVVYVASKRKLSVGDKMAGRHGNKGVIAKILPEEDMPFLPNGTPVDIVLNPLGVPSRMNVGQVLEAYLGWAAKVLNTYIATPVFGGISEKEIKELLKKANLPEDGRVVLNDGLSGEPFDQKVTVGYIYMMKLIHLADEKIHARSIGPYSLVTQQPLGGRAQYGGQRFGEMEVWALEAYGAAYTLQELLTVKSDDVQGRTKIYEAIVKGDSSLKTGVPESFNVLIQELKGLSLDVRTEKKSEKGIKQFTADNDFDFIHIKLASPETIHSWSRGEVKKPETINYRTLKTEKDGLFCERIFGPTKDWECYCGKYKRIKHNGIICDRCGVEVTKSSVRRRRMAHIELASPVSHIWFFKAMPSKMGALLGMGIRDLERVLYYEEYVVIDPEGSPYKSGELLSETKYREAKVKYGKNFHAQMGAEAIKELLKRLDLHKLTKKLRQKAKSKRGKQVRGKILKRLRFVEAFKKSNNNPEWMIMDVIPVIPPDLRPLVPLDGGRFATSDLNDLYRRVINRNNRLKKLIELNAPEIIIRNEKRMLQEAVDALFDNGRHGRAVMGAGNRPLKSLSEMLKGKQGRFRQNLLGKRVDYSGRSVIVIGPELKLHQCGLPKKIALELFEPFIIKELKNRGHVHTIKSARKMVERTETEVWDILDEVIKGHPVLLNRAPTLHRLGIQAFQPVLIEGKAIKIHPLVCTPFNADFDGDQMAVHVPLSTEAKMEARLIMLSSNNIFSPAHGDPIVTPTQDIVLGCYYLSKMRKGAQGEGKIFSNPDEVIYAYEDKMVNMHAKIKVRIDSELIETTVGRVLFNDILPKRMKFVNKLLNKKAISEIIKECYETFGYHEVVSLLDKIKEKGFSEATHSGVSLAIADLDVPAIKAELITEANKSVAGVQKSYEDGIITAGERYNKVVDIWTHVTEQVSEAVFDNLDKFNPLFMMADSGARGSRQQIRQLVGMRGLMAKPSGEIIESPIISSFREGLTSLEYFISTHGGRKGLADTALKTADSGYLTRRLVDVAQDVIVMEEDCGTLNGIFVEAIVEGDEIMVPLKERIVGRVATDNIVDVISDEIIVKANEIITEDKAMRIQELGIEKIRIRSVLTCESHRGVCSKCYGTNLATGRIVELGEAIGVIAAQSIGEPGTQLTMRTFHIGGTASRIVEQSFIKAKHDGEIVFHGLKVVPIPKNKWIILNRNGQLSINDVEGIELERHVIPQGAILNVRESDKVKKEDMFVEWDPYSSPILTEIKGKVAFEDIIDGKTSHREVNETTNVAGRVIIEHSGDYHPQILILDKKDNVSAIYPLPAGAHIVVKERQKVKAGAVLAKTPRKVSKTRDITGGLPRVAELFEARKPKDPAVISEIDGTVEFGKAKKGQGRVIVKSPAGMEKEYLIPHGKHLNVYKGDKVLSGGRLTDGPVVPQDILRICGEKELQRYLLNEIQEVYRLQGVKINDKHIELIIRQMLRKVSVDNPGDTEFLGGQRVDKFQFRKENDRVKKLKKKPASASPLLLGITKASLTTESFISAASFQETTRVLTEAAASGKIDKLFGLKENVIMGHLIPAGTGYKGHRELKIKKDLSSLIEKIEKKKDKEKSEDKKEEIKSLK